MVGGFMARTQKIMTAQENEFDILCWAIEGCQIMIEGCVSNDDLASLKDYDLASDLLSRLTDQFPDVIEDDETVQTDIRACNRLVSKLRKGFRLD